MLQAPSLARRAENSTYIKSNQIKSDLKMSKLTILQYNCDGSGHSHSQYHHLTTLRLTDHVTELLYLKPALRASTFSSFLLSLESSYIGNLQDDLLCHLYVPSQRRRIAVSISHCSFNRSSLSLFH